MPATDCLSRLAIEQELSKEEMAVVMATFALQMPCPSLYYLAIVNQGRIAALVFTARIHALESATIISQRTAPHN